MGGIPPAPPPDDRCCTRLKHLSGYVGASCCDRPTVEPEPTDSEGEWGETRTAT